MNKREAQKIAQTVTNEQLQQMLNKAKEKITDWAKPSVVNESLTKNDVYHIFADGFDVKKNYITIYKTNMIREFSEYLPKGF
jgi:hypothetical protein